MTFDPPMDEEQEILFRQLSQRFKTEWVPLRFGDVHLKILRVRDPDSLLDEEQILAGHQEVDWQPYWAQAWDAALMLSEQLSGMDFAGTRVLDLGCGLGITGAVVAARGGQVTMGDYAEPAVEFARLNSWPWRSSVRVLPLNWRTDQLTERFDWIVAADILYDRDEIVHLDRFWRIHLKPGGKILHGDPNRAMTVEFLSALDALGWQVTTRLEPFSARRCLRLTEFELV